MRFEKFEASDMRAALAAIKASMGPDAVIVATRELSRGGLFRRPRIEVTAAVEEAPAQAATPQGHAPHQQPQGREAQNHRGQSVRSGPAAQDLIASRAGAAGHHQTHASLGASTAQPTMAPGYGAAGQPVAAPAQEPEPQMQQAPQMPQMQQHLAPPVQQPMPHAPQAPVAMPQSMQPQAPQTVPAQPAAPVQPVPSEPVHQQRIQVVAPSVDVRALDVRLAPLRRELRALRGALKSHDQGPDKVQRELIEMRQMLASLSLQGHGNGTRDLFGSILEAADVAPEMREKLTEDARQLCQTLDLHNPTMAVSQQVRVLKEVIAGQLMTFPHFFEQAGPRRVALAGPTGVGKTTTIAKLAAHAALKHGQRVALISLDTYRIGAEEQIGHYARLIDVPLVVAHDAYTFNQALQRFASYDLVLIDTAGRSPMQIEAHRTQLAQLFAGHGIQIYLILAGSTRWLELSSAMQELSAPNGSALILTKLDEAVALGSCLNASLHCGLPIAFVTTGQRVPEDLAVAAPADLASRLVDRVFESTRTAIAGRPHRSNLTTGRALRDQVA